MRSREFQNILVKCSETLCVTLLHQEAWGTTQGLSCPVPSSPVPAMVHTEHAYRDCTVKICVLPTPSLCMHVSSPYYGVPVLYHCLDFALNRSMRGGSGVVRGGGHSGPTMSTSWEEKERRRRKQQSCINNSLLHWCDPADQRSPLNCWRPLSPWTLSESRVNADPLLLLLHSRGCDRSTCRECTGGQTSSQRSQTEGRRTNV